MANAHVQVEKFENGDIEYFLEHLDICSLANEWTLEKRALMIAICLRGEALEVYKYTKLWMLKVGWILQQ